MYGWVDHPWFIGLLEVQQEEQGSPFRIAVPAPYFTLVWKEGNEMGELMPIIDKNLRSYPAPNIVVIQLGSNDLGILKGKELIELIKLDVLRLRTLLPNVILVWSEILPRRYWHVANNQVAVENSRKRVNTAAKAIFLNEIQKGFIIRHPNIRMTENVLYRYDGVHLSDAGNNVYLNNIQGGLELCFSNVNCKLFPQES